MQARYYWTQTHAHRDSYISQGMKILIHYRPQPCHGNFTSNFYHPQTHTHVHPLVRNIITDTAGQSLDVEQTVDILVFKLTLIVQIC